MTGPLLHLILSQARRDVSLPLGKVRRVNETELTTPFESWALIPSCRDTAAFIQHFLQLYPLEGGDSAMAKTDSDIAIGEMLGTVEEAMSQAINGGETCRRR